MPIFQPKITTQTSQSLDSTVSLSAEELGTAFGSSEESRPTTSQRLSPSPPPYSPPKPGGKAPRTISNTNTDRNCPNHPGQVGMCCLTCYKFFCLLCMESSDKNNAFTCKTCASGKKQDVTHEYRALTRKRIASVSENESDHAVAKKKPKR